ncbi:hypothetical protein CVD28_13235 [Bacillus sp. M6-12]|nr:hypothetical protein CVD28_13235 [Bacillus sp. M6-12]
MLLEIGYIKRSSYYKWKATQPQCEEKARQEQDLREQHNDQTNSKQTKKRAPIEYRHALTE